jgi:hypothetical protein
MLPGASAEAKAMQPPGGPRENLLATVESFSPQHEAARHLSRLRVRLDGVRGNSRALHRLCRWAMDCTDKGRHRRGGKRSSDTWEQCTRGLDRVKIARPCLREVKRRRVCACRLGLAPRMRVQPRNRMRENCTSRTVRGGPGNRHSYRRGYY